MPRAVAACLTLGSLLLAAFAFVRPFELAAPAAAAEGPGQPPPGPGGMPPGGPPPGPGAMRPGGPPPAGAAIDSFVAERDSLMKDVLQRIAGRENAPAESVFKNIKVLKGVPAGRIPRIMNMGFGHSLGVRCAHCHVENHWADEDKPQKQIAREMMAMVDTITSVMLPRIKNLKSEHPRVSCSTCHRGSRVPATSF